MFVRAISLVSFAWKQYAHLPSSDTDAAGYPTVGYGHLCKDSKCSDVKYKIPLSKDDGKKLLADDMKVRTSFRPFPVSLPFSPLPTSPFTHH
jgi:hypothetical protein